MYYYISTAGKQQNEKYCQGGAAVITKIQSCNV